MKKVPPQQRASDPQFSVFVTANAGSGKTTTLVDRTARLLLAGADPAAIVCVTYTKAAAAEMQRRLFDRLGGWSIAADADLRRDLGLLQATAPETFDDASVRRARTLFARALETPGGLKVLTIHAFCERLLRRFPLEAGVSPRFTVLDDAAARDLQRRARDDLAILATTSDGPLKAAFERFCRELAPDALDTLLTHVETKRGDIARYLAAVEAGAALGPMQVCGFAADFDGEAFASEVAGRTDWASWDAWAEALDRGSDGDRKRAAALRAVDRSTTDIDALCGPFVTVSDRTKLKGFGTKAVDPAVCAALETEADRLLEARETIRAWRIAQGTLDVLSTAAAYLALYEREKVALGALDFADLIEKTQALLADRPAAAWVLYKLDGGIDHILIDEAQDTAPEQWGVFRGLTEEMLAGLGARETESPRTLFVVGDEKQSIYSFQGARPQMLIDERAHYSAWIETSGGAYAGVELETSYRSVEKVLKFVDAVFAGPDRAQALTLEQAKVVKHTAVREGQNGTVDIWPLHVEPEAPERRPWTDPVDSGPKTSASKSLAQDIVREIRASVARGDAVWDSKAKAWRPAGYGDFLVLVRKRSKIFEEILRALKLAGVPVSGADRLRLSEHIVFSDLLGLARFALYPNDDLTLAALLRSPLCDIDEDSLFALARDRGGSLWSALERRAGERDDWTAARRLFAEAIDEARRRRPFDFFGRMLGRLDVKGGSVRRRFLARLGGEAEEAIDEFCAQVLAIESRGVHDLESVVAALERSDVEVKREMEEARGEVRVMTVHGAKGLEAPIVILPDTTSKPRSRGSGLLETDGGGFLWAPRKAEDCPASTEARAYGKRRNDEESLRLLYVALTRARDRLIICGVKPKQEQDSESESWRDVLEDTLERLRGAAGVRKVEDGSRTFDRYGDDPAPVSAQEAETASPSPLPAWATAAARPEPVARWAAPSGLVGSTKDVAPSPLARTGGLGRFRRGDLIHKLFEVLPDVPPSARRAAARARLAREPDLTEEQRSEILEATLAVLEDPAFAEVFGPGSRPEVAVAGAAPELPEGISVSGKIDRLAVTPQRVLVVDYKTNRPAPDRAEDADPAYIAQLAAYVAVLRRVYPGRRVEAALLWTDGPRITPLTDSLVEAALSDLRG